MKEHREDRDRQGQSENLRQGDSPSPRRAYNPPALVRHAKLPVITAGSISEESWQFDIGEPD